MPIRVACSCGRVLNAKDELAGKRVKCPACGQGVVVQAAGGSPPAAPPSPPSAPRPAMPPAPPSPAAGGWPAGQPTQAGLGGGFPGGAGHPAMGYDPLGGQQWGMGGMGQFPGQTPGGFGGPVPGGMGYGMPGAGFPGAFGASPAPAPRRKASGGKTWLIVGGAGGGVAVLAILIGLVLFFTRGPTPVAQNAPGSGTPESPAAPPATIGPTTPVAPNTTPPTTPPATTTPPTTPPTTTPPNTTPPATGNPGAGVPSPSGPDKPATNDPPAQPSPDPSGTKPVDGPDADPPQGEKPPAGKGPVLSGLQNSLSTWRENRQQLQGLHKLADHRHAYEYSWMVDLLPHLGYEADYKGIDFKKTWAVEGNKLPFKVIPEFLDPAQPQFRCDYHRHKNMAMSHFVGMSGVEDSRVEFSAAELPRSHPLAGVFGYESVAKPSEITDGQSQTIMVLGSGGQSGPWVSGGGSTIRGARGECFDELTGFGSPGLPQRGTQAMFADGSVRTISAKINPKVFRAMCTIHGADSVDMKGLGDHLSPPRP